FAALLTCLQALFWSPFGLPYLRMLLAVVLLPVLAGVGLLHESFGLSERVLVGLYGLLIGTACLAAQEGLGRARRGDSPELAWLPSRQRSEASVAMDIVTGTSSFPSSSVARPFRPRKPFRS